MPSNVNLIATADARWGHMLLTDSRLWHSTTMHKNKKEMSFDHDGIVTALNRRGSRSPPSVILNELFGSKVDIQTDV